MLYSKVVVVSIISALAFWYFLFCRLERVRYDVMDLRAMAVGAGLCNVAFLDLQLQTCKLQHSGPEFQGLAQGAPGGMRTCRAFGTLAAINLSDVLLRYSVYIVPTAGNSQH